MPLLAREPDCCPANLLEATSVAGSSDGRWVAFYTLSRREKDLMRKLVGLQVPFYAPVIRRRLKSPGGRVRESFVPLFPGYVFARVDDDQRRTALTTNTIARWLPIADEAALLRDLRAIKQLIDADQPLTPEARIEPGQQIRVRSGPMRGIEGTVLRRHGCQRLVVAVTFLNQGASVEIEDVDLETIG
jgi:transcription antitermination factor NusG